MVIYNLLRLTFGARYDDTTLGRWTQQDPVGGSLGDTGATNRYVCTRDNPVNLSDPTGRDAIGAINACILGAVAGVAALYIGAFIAALAPAAEFVAPTLVAVLLSIVLGCILGQVLYNLGNLLTATGM